VAACIASRSDTPEPLWLRTSADLGITWGRPVRVPGIWSRDRGAFSERQLAAAVIGDRIVVAGLVQDQRDLVLTVAEATATAGAIAWRGPPRQLRIADRPWAALLLWADDRGATVVLGYNGLEVVPVAEGQPLTLRRIVVPGHRVPDVDLMRLATGALAIAWSDDRHGSRMGLPLPLPISRPQSDHEDVHVGILSADGTLRTIQASTTGGHAHAPVLGHLDGQAVVLWAEHPLRESRNVTGSRGAATAIRMRPLD
jgi:hypothetical protein